MAFDLASLQLGSALVLSCSAALLAMLSHAYRGLPGVRAWSVGLLLMATGLVVPVLPIEPVAPAAPAGLFFAGTLALWSGVRRNAQPAAAVGRPILLLAGLSTVALSLVSGSAAAAAEGLAFSAASLVALMAARDCSGRRAGRDLALRHAVVAGFAVTGLALLGQAVAVSADTVLPALAFTIGLGLLSLGLPLLALERRQRADARLAMTDELTSLPNRRGFFKEAGRLVNRARQDRQPTAVLMMDLDGFSAVNRRFGHGGGDRVLAALAAELRDGMRPADLVGRLGGEEFCACMPGVTAAEAGRIADRLRARIAAQRIDVDGEAVAVSISIGVVSLGIAELAVAIDAADRALYSAKAQGRNRVCVAGAPSPSHVATSVTGGLLHAA